MCECGRKAEFLVDLHLPVCRVHMLDWLHRLVIITEITSPPIDAHAIP